MDVLSKEYREKEVKEKQELCKWFLYDYRDQGYDTAAAEKKYQEGLKLMENGNLDEALVSFSLSRKILREAQLKPDFPYIEPETLEEIIAQMDPQRYLPSPYDIEKNSEEYYDKVYGCWLGKTIGGALGEPVEGWTWQKIRETYGEVWNYIKPPNTINDDTTYEVVYLHALETYGPKVSSEQIAWEWVRRLPLAHVTGAIAIKNLKKGIVPPLTSRIENPFSEWIGAMMKGELPGMIAPGRPDLAADYAFRDGMIAHRKNGLYGEILNAVMISLAFVEKDIEKLLLATRGYLPQKARIIEFYDEAIAWCRESKDWEEACKKLYHKYETCLSFGHTFNNLIAVIIGLWFGKGDFERATCITNMCGMDTDCTAGQTAAVMGTIIGAENIPDKWKSVFNDRFETYVVGYKKTHISDLAKRTCQAGKRIILGN